MKCSRCKEKEAVYCPECVDKIRALSRTSELPCSAPCSKCGSEDIYRRFFAEGEDTNGLGPNRDKKSSDFVNRENAWVQPAKKDCVTNHCRCCGYRWDSEPLKPNRVIDGK